MQWLTSFFIGLFVERFIETPARRDGSSTLLSKLEHNGHKIEQILAQASDTPTNREQARHIIGIERWGQRRLRVALGEAATNDELDGYLPPDGPMSELAKAWEASRNRTIEYARQLVQRDLGSQRVAHNQFGELSINGWLRYLSTHATMEARRLKNL